jgi:hypothetical protein
VTQVAEQIEITVESLPPGATIRADGEEIGTAPVAFTVDVGRDEVSLVAELSGWGSTTSTCVVAEAVLLEPIRCYVVLEAPPPLEIRKTRQRPVQRPAAKEPAVEAAEVEESPTEGKKRKPKIDLID